MNSGIRDDDGVDRIGAPNDIWSDGTTLWVHSGALGKLVAFNLSTKARDSAKDVNVASVWGPVSMTGHGSTVWVGQRNLNRLWAYSLDSKSRDPGKDITLHPDNGNREALWTDGTTMWVMDNPVNRDTKLYAYSVSDGARQPDKEIDIPEEIYHAGAMWSDGTTMWFPHISWSDLFAYSLSDGTRQPEKDYEYFWGVSADNIFHGRPTGPDPAGMWSNGATTWVSLSHSLPAYRGIAAYVAVPPTKRLEAGSVTATTATLTLRWHTGDWHYQANTGPDATCSSPAQTGATASLTGLTAGQSYTYTAYSDSSCAAAIASVTFTAQASAGASGAFAQASAGTVDIGAPVLRIEISGQATWEYTTPQGAERVSTELRWMETAGRSAGDWTGKQSRVFDDGGITGYAIPGLSLGVEYKAQVVVTLTVGGAETYAESATLVFTLPAATGDLPGAVVWVMAVHNGDNVSALWLSASGSGSYEARYSDDNGATWRTATAPSVGTALTITGLSSEKTYIVGVRASNSTGAVGWTNSAPVSPPGGDG